MKPVDTDSWETPDDLFNVFNKIYHFDIDVCASYENSKCDSYLTKEDDYTKSEIITESTLWMNPPYSRGNIDKCMEKASIDSIRGKTVICLVRDDPSTNWYNKYVDGEAYKVLRLKHRIKFKGAEGCYNFPVCVVIYNRWNLMMVNDGRIIYKQWWIGEEI